MNDFLFNSIDMEELDRGFEAVSNGNELAPITTREKAVNLVKKYYLGKYPIEYFPENIDEKHDRIVAELTYAEDQKETAEKYLKSLISSLNKKNDEFTFVYRDKYIFANPREKNQLAEETTPKSEEESTLENTIYNSESTYCGLFVDDFKRTPLVEHYINEFNLKPDEAVNIAESYVIANPFHALDIIDESMFKTEEEYDNALLEAFLFIANSEYTEEALQAGFITAMNRDIVAMEDATIIRKKIHDAGKKVKHAITGAPNPKTMRTSLDKKVNTAKGILSPIAKKIQDTVDELIGGEAERREIIKGGIKGHLLKIRRIVLKLFSLYAVKNALFATVMPGGILIRLIAWVASLGMYAYTIADKSSSKTRSAVIGELELELKIAREKIEDAKSRGDVKAKYELMRIENKLEEEIFRVKYNKVPKRHAH